MLLVCTAFSALTFSLALTFGNPLAFQSVRALISLSMIASIAIPVVCSESSRPFWAAYAICTGIVILLAGTEGDPFSCIWDLPLYLQSPTPPQGKVTYHPTSAFFFIQPWIPTMIGIVGGFGFSLISRFLRGSQS